MPVSSSALLVIDVQMGLDDPDLGQRNNPEAEQNIARLLAEWRAHDRPIIHIKHNSVEPNSPLRPELPGNEVKDEARPLPGETQFGKSVNSAFIGTGLEQHLREQGISSLVIVGLTTDHCVSASTRTAADLGFDVVVVSDATAAHGRVGFDGISYTGDMIHRISLVTLDEEFCMVRSTEQVLEELA